MPTGGATRSAFFHAPACGAAECEKRCRVDNAHSLPYNFIRSRHGAEPLNRPILIPAGRVLVPASTRSASSGGGPDRQRPARRTASARCVLAAHDDIKPVVVRMLRTWTARQGIQSPHCIVTAGAVWARPRLYTSCQNFCISCFFPLQRSAEGSFGAAPRPPGRSSIRPSAAPAAARRQATSGASILSVLRASHPQARDGRGAHRDASKSNGTRRSSDRARRPVARVPAASVSDSCAPSTTIGREWDAREREGARMKRASFSWTGSSSSSGQGTVGIPRSSAHPWLP